MSYSNTEAKFHLPGIGMRIVKSAMAVAACFMVDKLRGSSSIVFYSILAAMWCIQLYSHSTINNAIQRFLGTFIGAIWGLIYLLIYPFATRVFGPSFWIDTVMVSLFTVVILYSSVVFDKKPAAYLACVVFFSIAVNHIGDEVPYIFVLNRFLDTSIGIIIGLLINNIKVCYNPDTERLYVAGLEETLLIKGTPLSGFSKVELNRMIDRGLRFTVTTYRTPASLLEMLRDVRLNLPVVAMDGAVIYDTNKNYYLRVVSIDDNRAKRIMDMINERDISWYANVIIDDVLLIYYSENSDAPNVNFVNDIKSSPYMNFLKRPLPNGEDVVCFSLLDKSEKLKPFYESISNSELAASIRIDIYESVRYPGYSYIKIYDKDADYESRLEELKSMFSIKESVSFGLVPGKYDVVVKKEDPNEVVRSVRKRFEPPFYRKS
ncbi:MAG: HAD hydrolase family protein [Saccharofermentans sp.]|nr:HAD hydrolase family protein [Saccharofermentans sp.]